MKIILIFFFLLEALFAFESDFSLYYESISLEEKSSFSTAYLELKHENIPTDFGVSYNISATLNAPIYRENDFYDYLETEILLSSVSLDYYSNSSAFSLGRNRVDFALLNGNFDGVIYYKLAEIFSYKLFYFLKYETLLPSYYTQNDSIDILGVNVSYENKYVSVKATAMKNRDENIYHTKASVMHNRYTLSLEAAAYSAVGKKNEQIAKVFASKSFNNSFIELGYMKNFQGAIDKLLQFEQSELNYFGLGNKIYSPNAANIYMEYLVDNKNYYFDFLLGYTEYEKNLQALEADISLVYYINKEINIEAHIMREETTTESTTLISSALNYRFSL